MNIVTHRSMIDRMAPIYDRASNGISESSLGGRPGLTSYNKNGIIFI